MNGNLTMIGNVGLYSGENTSVTFQLGESLQMDAQPVINTLSTDQISWMHASGYNIACRGFNDAKCIEVANDIKRNRLLPRLISKQCNMLYGHGLAVYRTELTDGKYVKKWYDVPQINNWLDSWMDNGMELPANAFAQACIKNYYYHYDFFCKFRFSAGKGIVPGTLPIAGIESMENKDCKLATLRKPTDFIRYKDFTAIAVGNGSHSLGSLQMYPKFDVRDIDRYRFAAISHHRCKSVNEFYGLNETHEGTIEYIKASNNIARYLNSFFKNSLAAKVHIIIPNAWVDAKRNQIMAICRENIKRKKDNQPLFTFDDIEVGTEYSESFLIEYINTKLKEVTNFLSGAEGQGKSYASYSFRTAQGIEEWKFDTLDLKYKEYVSSLVEYDKRADEVLLSSLGLDSSISSVSKDGVISKSGSDSYYNYLIYLLQLSPDDEVCSEPFNLAVKINWPDLYKEGYRLGFYREVPSRQEDVSPKNRLNTQQS